MGKILSFLGKLGLKDHRLGDLLVAKGLLRAADLDAALRFQSATGQRLGHILIDKGFVSRPALHKALARQCAIRFMILAVSAVLSFTSVLKSGKANAGEFGADLLQMVSYNSMDVMEPEQNQFPLFGTGEVKSGNTGPFTKFNGMFRRFETEFHAQKNKQAVDGWRAELEPLKNLSLEQKATRVNKIMNDVAYMPDSKTWGQSDYWATPIEFMERGAGDCEDYALAKYASLRALGVPEDRMRLVILQDTAKNIPHAILAVYAESGVLILDNQAKTVKYDTEISNYKPIFSINRQGWWLHKGRASTVLASR